MIAQRHGNSFTPLYHWRFVKLDSLLKGDARTHYRLAQAQRALGDQAAAKACLAAAAANGWGGDSWWLTVERTLFRRQAGGS